MHATLVSQAIDAGKPVFCEKPLAFDLESTVALVDKAEAANAVIQVGFQRRFDPAYVEAKRLLDTGELGTLYMVRLIAHDHTPPPDAYIPVSGGLFRDSSIHDFDALRWLTGQEVVEVYATGAVRNFPVFAKHDDVDTGACIFTLEDGTIGSHAQTRHNPLGYDVRMEVVGSKDVVCVGLDGRTPIRSLERGRARHGEPRLGLVPRPLRGGLPHRAARVPARRPRRDPEPVHRSRRHAGDADRRRVHEVTPGAPPRPSRRGALTHSPGPPAEPSGGGPRFPREAAVSAFGIGVVGIGDISDVYIANLARYPDIVKVVACAARDVDKARAKAARHGIPRAYATPDELFADPAVDIVLNLTTPAAHAALNLAALRAGKHVYSEKPLGATFADSRAIIDAAAAGGLRVGCAPDTFMGGRLQTFRRLLDDGRLGDVVGASAFVVSHGHEWHHPNPDFFYQPGAGPLLDIGPYYVTALLALLGPVTSVAAMTSRTFARRTIESEPLRGQEIEVRVDTHVTGVLRFASGALGTLIASFDVWDSELPRLEIYGTRGTVCMPDPDPLSGPNLFGGPVLFRDAEGARWRGVPRAETPSPWVEIPIEHPFTSTSHATNSRGIGLVDMAHAIRDGRPERASGAMALHSMELMEGMLTSGAEDRFVRLETTFARPAPLPVDWPAGERH